MSKKNKKEKKTFLNKRNVSSVPMIVMCFILLAIVIVLVCDMVIKPNNQDQEPEKQKNIDPISINLISGSLVDETQYNVWFYVNCNETDGDISFKPSVGYVLQMDIADEANVQPVENLSPNEVDRYAYVWIVEKTDKDFVGYVDVEYENNTMLKTASIYSIFSNETIGFLEREQYKEYEQAIAEKNSEQVTE